MNEPLQNNSFIVMETSKCSYPLLTLICTEMQHLLEFLEQILVFAIFYVFASCLRTLKYNGPVFVFPQFAVKFWNLRLMFTGKHL